MLLQTFIDFLGNQAFINFISTFGLAVLLVIYFVLIRDPSREKETKKREDNRDSYWQKKYDELSKNYGDLNTNYHDLEQTLNKFWTKQYEKLENEFDGLNKIYQELENNYQKLENDLRPETRKITPPQSNKLSQIGLDRDLYKLYYYACEKIDGRRAEDMNYFIEEVIRDTNTTWSEFVSPFPNIPRIGQLYDIYTNNGNKLKIELEAIIGSDKLDNQVKKDQVLAKLMNNTVRMKSEFDNFVQRLTDGMQVKAFQDGGVNPN
ncbi:DUF4047 domain-containing protein [Nostoc sp. C110]|uniref:DUF4047 domain-containing protein n=1 Tax=Nostoc sp. C110 TaxID=3349876 RepID=UPI00370D3CE1